MLSPLFVIANSHDVAVETDDDNSLLDFLFLCHVAEQEDS
jgi:hypothetical protein